ncbi:MAG TPA: nitrite reductase, partial [Clostridiales bacterium UBA8960]|nr:nitrite reductase [Clostridiales bacterium UBA8960]
MKEKIVIVGNGAAGNAALEEILSQNATCELTVITSEGLPIYYRPMLSEYISETQIPKRFYLHEQSWYDSNNVSVMYEKSVLSINPSEQTLTLSDNQIVPYDKLILTTGSKNFIPPIPGSKRANVYDLRTFADAEQIKAKASDAKKAVIIGGGLLGLELGWQLRKLNIDVTVIEMMQRLLPRQLDEEASEIFEEKVSATGIKVLKGVQTMEIVGNELATGVLISTGETIEADMVMFSIGIRADVFLAKEAGLLIERGIVVNDFMETSIKNIFAAGDCAEFSGINYAIWPEAVEQGKIAGLNAIGIKTVYQ